MKPALRCLSKVNRAVASAVKDTEVLGQEEKRNILRQFILPNPPGMDDMAGDHLPNASLSSLYYAWGLPSTHILPMFTPISLSPYQYYTTHNEESSVVKCPRLSVTKMLVNSWCQLREYYQIYAGSPRSKSKAMTAGQNYHNLLELQLHEHVDTSDLQSQLQGALVTIDTLMEQEGAEGERYISSADLLELVLGNVKESELARDWSTQIINRLYSLITTSEAREVLVHCFVDLDKKRFVAANEDSFGNSIYGRADSSMVLISGVVDHFHILNISDQSDISLFKDIRDGIDYFFTESVNGNQILDLTEFFKIAEPIIHEHSKEFKITTSDVKTRSRRMIPQQQSVVTAAKLQTFYYRKMLGILSNEHLVETNNSFAYYSLLENAKVRMLDLDSPINATMLVRLLKENFHLYYDDFVKLANGDPIGFAPFDEYVAPYRRYDLRFLDITEPLTEAIPEELNYKELLTKKLLTNWKTPPTLRYFAARSSQFYGLLGPLLGQETAVEYHTSGHCFHVNKYKYNENDLDLSLQEASLFWNGQKYPQHTDELEKCKYCEFHEKCTVPNGLTSSSLPSKSDIGYKLNEFIHSD